MKKKVYIALAADNNYSGYAAVVIMSAIKSLNKNWNLDITIFDGGIEYENKARIKSICVENSCILRFYDVSCDIGYEELPTMEHWSKAMYYRLSVGDAIPISAPRVIYLDCDVLVTKSLHYLFEMDLEGKLLGAVENPDSSRLCELGIKKSKKYFNSGVLLIDMLAWRKNKLKNRALEICYDYREKLISPDQDILNILYDGKVKFLSFNWNMQVSMFRNKKYWHALENFDGIIHFTTNVKPWHVDDPHPRACDFRKIAEEINVSTGGKELSLLKNIKYYKRYLSNYFLFLLFIKITRY
ncbi:glycosyltransferase family 8 protein [Photobacterium phosphoreum]|uniref:glycosyltransferase family 8 protein n=1 Tax=Photobacterium phosphoreum TaxID=659 RepID=UPI000D17FAC0|nr:glycosyltransferase family 8 protein [Photobacterium phosphoreum]PSU32580.1 hypothetical protein CTM85_19910 [Photobacterium phosphoreum]